MKSKAILLSTLLPLATAGLAISFTGCASTATRESTGEYIDNSVLTAKVKAALAKDKTVSAMAVNVESFKGRVQLSGFVDSAEQKRQAEIVARGIEGVQEVENNITVK
jgi:hyperosmotically inducible protein